MVWLHGCWQEALDAHYTVLLMGLPGCPYNPAAGILQSKWSERARQKSQYLYKTLSPKFHNATFAIFSALEVSH